MTVKPMMSGQPSVFFRMILEHELVQLHGMVQNHFMELSVSVSHLFYQQHVDVFDAHCDWISDPRELAKQQKQNPVTVRDNGQQISHRRWRPRGEQHALHQPIWRVWSEQKIQMIRFLLLLCLSWCCYTLAIQ